MAEKRRLTTEERTERKKTLAGERNTRVLFADNPDAHIMLDMTTALNRGVKILRNQLGKRIPYPIGIELLKELDETERMVHKTTQKICEAVGVRYRAPRAFETEVAAVGDVEGSKAEKSVEDKMDMAYAAAGASEIGNDGKGDKKASKKT
jgi:hypothetical protein